MTDENPFGIVAFLHWNHAWNRWHFDDKLVVQAIQQLHTLGVSSVRLDILWSDVHRGLYQYDFARYDRLISLIRDQGIDPLILLHYNKIKDGPDGELWNRPPDSFEEFARYVGATVAHFKDRVHKWEIWNEPNHPVYWTGPKDKMKLYADLLKISYDAAKTADPSCLVLNGGLTDPVVEDLANLYDQGCKNKMDIISIHPFIDPFAPDREDKFNKTIEGVHQVMKNHGDEKKKIWITEMGCPGLPAGKAPQKWFAGECPNEEEQARWLETQYQWIRKYPFVEKLFWAFYRDTEDIFKEGADHLGLVHFDLSPKPAFLKMQKLIEDFHRDQYHSTAVGNLR